MNKVIFEDLFVLEMAQNHYGDVNRGLKIIDQFSKIARFNNVYAAMKLQFRDVETFIHKDFRDRKDVGIIKKSVERWLSKEGYETLVAAARQANFIPMATPFDEKSVELCEELGIQIIKIQSSDLNDWLLIEKIAKTRKPVIASTGGSSLKDLDDLVLFFENRNIPLALNHCVSLYPTEDHDMELNQIDFLINRYPDHTIGLSSHEHNDWTYSVIIAYAKGARTFERHVDIDDGNPVPAYNSLPEQIDKWFKAHAKAKEMCGNSPDTKRVPPLNEIKHLDTFVRGVYAKKDLSEGCALCDDDIYLAIPLQKGQISCREYMRGTLLLKACAKDQPIMIDSIDSPYVNNTELKKMIYERGL